MPFIGRIGRPGLIGLAARTAVVAGTATAVSGGMAARQQRRAEDQYEQQQFEAQQQQAQTQQAVAQHAPPAPAGGDVTGELQRLAGLHQQGILTDEEFSAAKQKLLGL